MRRLVANGFTLLEMLVVLALLGLIGGLGFPAIGRMTEGQMFRTAAMQIDVAVRRAQADALSTGRSVRVAPFHNDDQRSSIALVRNSVSTGMKIDQPTTLTFYRDGTSSGGTISLASGHRLFRLVIDPQTGAIRSAFQ